MSGQCPTRDDTIAVVSGSSQRTQPFHIVDSIQNKTLKHLKIQGDMPSELKALIRLRKQLILKQGVLYRRITPIDAKPRLQLILPPSHHTKAIEGCHDQVGHLGQDRVLELLRDSILLAWDAH